jgi:hypothetical protein
MNNVQYTEWLRKLSITQLHQEHSNMTWCSEQGVESKDIAKQKVQIVQTELDKRALIYNLNSQL